jgi:transposase-like protein
MEAIRWLALFSQVRFCFFVLVVIDESLPGAAAMDFPIRDLMNPEGCRQKLFDLLHPEGFACPRCGAREGLNIHRRHPDSPVLDYRCKACRRVFNMFTGTPWQGTHLSPIQILLILRGIAQGVPTAKLAREVGISRQHLLRLRHEIQARALAAADRSPLPDERTEADEMYQNAGEKRGTARRPRRPAPAARQSGQGPRHVGDRPAAGPRGGRPRQRTGAVAGRPPERRGRVGRGDGPTGHGAGGEGLHR